MHSQKPKGVRVLSAPETLALDSLVEKSPCHQRQKRSLASPRTAACRSPALWTEHRDFAQGAMILRSEQLLLRARAILPEDEESLREDAKNPCANFCRFRQASSTAARLATSPLLVGTGRTTSPRSGRTKKPLCPIRWHTKLPITKLSCDSVKPKP